ncbi:hypothetical protein ES319_D07G157900v1, partial [Gossypium barbadense]
MKFLSWNCRGMGSPATIRELKQLLVANRPDIIFLCETKMNAIEFQKVQTRCRMQNGLVVNSDGRSGGLALMWKDELDVTIKSYSKHHIDSIVKLGCTKTIRVMGYYGHANPSERNSSWNMLRSVGAAVKEEWVVGAYMNDFRDIIDDLALVNIKPDPGWFTWVNNREWHRLIKERLDRFLKSVSMVEKFPFIASSVIRQSQSDHDAILFYLYGCKPKCYPRDNRIRFRYEDCWITEKDIKRIINKEWKQGGGNYENKLENVRVSLGNWQKQNYWRMKRDISRLEDNINKIIDSTSRDNSVKMMREYRLRLNHLYDREERYWAQRSRVQWLKGGDRNTKYFHTKATRRLKKNSIEKIKYENGNWITNSNDICKAARNYFWNLFRSNGNDINQLDVSYIKECITSENNSWLTRDYNVEEINNAIKQMNPSKAPGIDGLSRNFYKQHWDIVGDDTK